MLEPAQCSLLQTLVEIPSVSGEEEAILQYLEQVLSVAGTGCRCISQPVPGGRRNLIALKGEGAFKVLLLGHVDSVAPDKLSTQSFWRRDEEHAAIHGKNIWDMKGGIMLMADTMRTLNVPEGMTIVAAFVCDEEANSAGALTLRESEIMNGVRLILSPEIRSLSQESDSPVDVIIGRMGNLKTRATVEVRGRARHEFVPNVPNAIAAIIHLRNHLFDNFAVHRDAVQRLKSPLFGDERITESSLGESPSGQFMIPPAKASLTFLQTLADTDTPERALTWQRVCAQRLADEQRWVGQGIVHLLDLQEGRTSYPPFLTDVRTETVQVLLRGIDAIYGGHRPAVGRSTADTNLLAEKWPNIPIIELGPLGQNPHGDEYGVEIVSEPSLAICIRCYRHLLTQTLPEVMRRGR